MQDKDFSMYLAEKEVNEWSEHLCANQPVFFIIHSKNGTNERDVQTPPYSHEKSYVNVF